MHSSTLFSAARSVFRRTACSAHRRCTRGSDHVYGSSSFACLSPHPSPRSSRHRYTYFIGNAARRLPKSKPRLLSARMRAPCLPGLTAGRRGRQDGAGTAGEENSSLWRWERDFAGEGAGTRRVRPRSDNATAATFSAIADLGTSRQKADRDRQEKPRTGTTKR